MHLCPLGPGSPYTAPTQFILPSSRHLDWKRTPPGSLRHPPLHCLCFSAAPGGQTPPTDQRRDEEHPEPEPEPSEAAGGRSRARSKLNPPHLLSTSKAAGRPPHPSLALPNPSISFAARLRAGSISLRFCFPVCGDPSTRAVRVAQGMDAAGVYARTGAMPMFFFSFASVAASMRGLPSRSVLVSVGNVCGSPWILGACDWRSGVWAPRLQLAGFSSGSTAMLVLCLNDAVRALFFFC